MTGAVEAWCLKTGVDQSIAIPIDYMREYVISPSLVYIPSAPNYCNTMCLWQNLNLPIMDLGVLAGNPESTSTAGVVIISYYEKTDSVIKHAGFNVYAPPTKLLIHNQELVDLPENYSSTLVPTVTSCFKHNEQFIYVHNIPYLFSKLLRESVIAA